MNEFNEFTYRTEEERAYLEGRTIYVLIDKLIAETKEQDRIANKKEKGEIFGHKIGFVITKELIPPEMNSEYVILKEASERITLTQISIQTNEIKLEIPYHQPNFSFKERIKILFKGRLWEENKYGKMLSIYI